MELSIILTTIVINAVTWTPDLCADVYRDASGAPYTDAIGQTWSRFCEWTGPSAPVLDLDVCCALRGDNARCRLPDQYGRCSTGSKYYCEHGEVMSTGAVVCYQPFPSVCEFGFCEDVLPPDGGPIEDHLCCWGDGACTEIVSVDDWVSCYDLGGYTGWCKNGATKEDGTVECFED